MGLGILGGGVETAKWLLKQGARLTITDLKPKEKLATSLKELAPYKKKTNFILGEHREKDFLDADIVVVNPDVPKTSKFLDFAKRRGKMIENELTLFYEFNKAKKLVGVTGTRGKTTTTNWIAHLLKGKFKKVAVAGNSPQNPLLAVATGVSKGSVIVVESPSFLLEHLPHRSPSIAVITNIYRDHLNRYDGMKDYAATKGRIFKSQKVSDFLVLNLQNRWTKFFLKKRPKSKILFFSTKMLPEKLNGVFVKNGQIFYRHDRREVLVMATGDFKKKWGSHNVENLLAATAVALALGVSQKEISKRAGSLPQIKFRQESVFKNSKLEIFNDTSATSPEATMAAIDRFSHGNEMILITGGTDRDLDYAGLAGVIKRKLKLRQIVFLNGSATEKILKGLKYKKSDIAVFETLKECFNCAIRMAKKGGAKKIVFSPGAKSFEKFKNEFDRGQQFNLLVEELKKIK